MEDEARHLGTRRGVGDHRVNRDIRVAEADAKVGAADRSAANVVADGATQKVLRQTEMDDEWRWDGEAGWTSQGAAAGGGGDGTYLAVGKDARGSGVLGGRRDVTEELVAAVLAGALDGLDAAKTVQRNEASAVTKCEHASYKAQITYPEFGLKPASTVNLEPATS